MTYTLTAQPDIIVRDEDGAFIPTDPDNIDYQAFLAWLDEGNAPTPYTPLPAAKRGIPMVESTTQHYGWTKPEITKSSTTWGGFINANLDSIDALIYSNQQGLAPVGAGALWFGATPPAGWILLQGQTLLRAGTYAALFAIFGTVYNVGTVAADSFMLPDFRARFPFGANPAGGNALGQLAGAFSVTLAIGNMPSHAHTATEAAHTHTAYQDVHNHVITTGNHQHNIVTGNHAHTVQTVIATGSGATNGGSVWSFGTATTTTAGDLGGYTTVYGNLGGSADNRQPAVTVQANTPPLVTVNPNGSGTPFNVVPPLLGINFMVKYQ